VEGSPDHFRLAKRALLVGTPASEVHAMFSPDGKWIAYTSDASGINEVYVRSSEGSGGRWQISQQGGSFPRWSRNGRELLYAVGGLIKRVDYTANGDSFVAGKPRPGPRIVLADLGGPFAYNVAPDGKRLIVVARPLDPNASKPDTQLNMLLNFFDEVKRRVK
jgi:dipeptidyl aminopeptidase/acylaminoacyl peptidase